MKASVSIRIDQPIDKVFAFAANIENMDQWVTGVSEPKLTSEGDFGVGSTFTSKYTYGGGTHNITYVVTDYDPPTRHAIKSTSGPFPFEGLIELETSGSQTQITNTIDAGADSKATSIMFAVLGPILRIMMRRQLRGELEALKTILEGN